MHDGGGRICRAWTQRPAPFNPLPAIRGDVLGLIQAAISC